MNTTGIGEKELLEIETLKQSLAMDMKRFDETRTKNLHDIQVDMKRIDIEQKRLGVEFSKKGYEGWRLSMYGIAVGLGGTFALAKTISLLGWVG